MGVLESPGFFGGKRVGSLIFCLRGASRPRRWRQGLLGSGCCTLTGRRKSSFASQSQQELTSDEFTPRRGQAPLATTATTSDHDLYIPAHEELTPAAELNNDDLKTTDRQRPASDQTLTRAAAPLSSINEERTGAVLLVVTILRQI